MTGSLTFDASGNLLTPAATDPAPSITVAGLNDGAAPLTMNWEIYNKTAPRITQYSASSGVSANSQNGFASAQLLRVGLGDGGQLLALYSNGQQQAVGQLAMASIRNPDSMVAVGDNNFQLSARTALPAIGVANTGGRGTIQGGAVESSNVDIAKEFTNLIVLQRGYQANTKVITTVDEISQDTINIKR